MGKSKTLSPTKRAQIVAFKNIGMSQRCIAAELGVSKTAVQLALAKFSHTGTYRDSPRSGRPQKTNTREDRILRRFVSVNPKASLSVIKAEIEMYGIRLGKSTISRKLIKMNLGAYRSAKKPLLTPKMRSKRLAFARKYANWTADDWGKVMWSDESTFTQFGSFTSFVRRPKGFRFVQRYTTATIKHPESIMAWGCISTYGRGGLTILKKNERMNSRRYIQLLDGKLQVFMNIHSCTYFMQDSAPCHVSKESRDWFAGQGVRLMEWPGNSPDLNPIENVWRIMKGKVSLRRPRTLLELQHAIRQVWTLEVTRELCEKCITSMPRRILEVIKNNGGCTKY